MPLDDKELFRKLLQAYGAVVNKPFATARAFEWQPDRQSLPGKEETVLGARVITPLVTDEALRVSDELYHAVRPMLAVSFRPGLNSRPGSSSPRSCRVSTALLALNRIERGPARTGGRRRQAEGCHRGLDLLSNPFLSANLRGNA
jgi:hypothetical protein